MKKHLFICLTVLSLFACSKEPTACDCGKNLMKNMKDQDADLAAACEKHVESLVDSEQINWYNESMECMNEQ